MPTLEAPHAIHDSPRILALSSGRRPGHIMFDVGHLFADQPDVGSLDLSRRSAIELSAGKDAAFFPPLRYDLDPRHDVFTSELPKFPVDELPATKMILSGLTRYIRSLADNPNFASGRPGLAAWSATHIELDRHTAKRDVVGNSLPREYRHGAEIGQVITAMVQLNGTRQFDIGQDGKSVSAPLLLPGKVALFRAPGLIDDAETTVPDFRFSKVFASDNNLTMTVMNRVVEPPTAA